MTVKPRKRVNSVDFFFRSNLNLAERFSQLEHILPEHLRSIDVFALINLSLVEDLCEDIECGGTIEKFSDGDVTSIATINSETTLEGRIFSKEIGILAGLPLAEVVFKLNDPEIRFLAHKPEGAALEEGDLLASVSGPGRSLLAAERMALNFLGRMSGVATLTKKYVNAVAGTQAVILDTRKTSPGWRRLDKYAVRVGGGKNHRQGLYDMVLIKDNHIDGAGGISKAVENVRRHHGNRYPIEVEVKDLVELEEALSLQPDRIMLDNMSLGTMQKSVEISAGRVPLEASGNVSLETVRDIAETGVNFISVGALTHSAPVFDISMRLAGNS
ncbi:MAG: carboxylating nicotinate-nucleotide diphosphorylase [Anaerolineales bacterium]|nr:carboxylating nicotinate-nucleotide diphosphorylase [Chloroflexota bacterium]MBL6979913.1 carboxylating nicotinate-nucleotide diphosphorylase [Anaerolineales bacterium]